MFCQIICVSFMWKFPHLCVKENCMHCERPHHAQGTNDLPTYMPSSHLPQYMLSYLPYLLSPLLSLLPFVLQCTGIFFRWPLCFIVNARLIVSGSRAQHFQGGGRYLT